MRIGLYFGSFNPIHKGHTALAQYIVSQGYVDEVWLVVSPNNPLKKADELADEHLRYEMAKIATNDMPAIRVSDLEFGLPKPSYTINSLRIFSERYPDHTFTLVIGSDNMSLFHRWREHEAILRDYHILVYPRQGDDLEALMRQYPAMQVAVGAPLLPVSATEIREALRNGSSEYDKWIEPEIKKFFLRFCLHKSDKSSTFATDKTEY